MTSISKNILKICLWSVIIIVVVLVAGVSIYTKYIDKNSAPILLEMNNKYPPRNPNLKFSTSCSEYMVSLYYAKKSISNFLPKINTMVKEKRIPTHKEVEEFYYMFDSIKVHNESPLKYKKNDFSDIRRRYEVCFGKLTDTYLNILKDVRRAFWAFNLYISIRPPTYSDDE